MKLGDRAALKQYYKRLCPNRLGESIYIYKLSIKYGSKSQRLPLSPRLLDSATSSCHEACWQFNTEHVKMWHHLFGAAAAMCCQAADKQLTGIVKRPQWRALQCSDILQKPETWAHTCLAGACAGWRFTLGQPLLGQPLLWLESNVQTADGRQPRPLAQSAASFTAYLLPYGVFRQIQPLLLKMKHFLWF